MSHAAHDLKAAGLRNTRPREAILQVLREADRSLSVEEIRARMPKPRPGIPTLYRNLERFVQEGWVESLPGPDQVLRFVQCHSHHHHHHLQCERCGRSVEIEACAAESVLAGVETATGFRITRHQLSYFGICPDCQGDPEALR